MKVLNSFGVAALAGTGVIFLVAVSESLGLAVIIGTVIGYLVVPLAIMYRRQAHRMHISVSDQTEETTLQPIAARGWFVDLVAGIARYRMVVILVFAVSCLPSGSFAVCNFSNAELSL